MKKIIITEDQLKTLMLVESAGVPNNLISATTNVIDAIYAELEKRKDIPVFNGISFDFFYDKQTEINLNANRALRKLAKLYSLLLEMNSEHITRIRRL